ncbi:MAG: O-methyltransferase [Acidobacteria bacterium]|jgi:predicted O-methyltransferase YrrM|nr:O-methyltransferase [Acidobacteriota bacterium]MBA3786040.1 O-methyltransferase [Acidobacteriota bacterium]MBA4186255.1 O-methyltransferase [Acidobacteriota bacterium]
MNIISAEIQDYAENFTSDENEILRELRRKTDSERNDRQMLSGLYQGRLLSMFSRMIAPRRILEIGTFMGYSALCLAEGLTPDGKIITLDIDEETNRTAKEFWARTEYQNKIESILGNASEIISTLDEIFDLVFIDADKPAYASYYDAVFPKLRVGGVIIADNVLRDGKVLEVATSDDEDTVALHKFNRKVQSDERVSNVLLAVRDGLMVVRKERE